MKKENGSKYYGVTGIKKNDNELSIYEEEFDILGFTVMPEILTKEELQYCRESLDKICDIQEKEFGQEKLKKINEQDLVRCPFKYDDFFLYKLATNDKILSFSRKFLGEYFILHLQNGIINHPDREHHQSSWHRDLPYQNYVVSKPIALSVLFCIDDFTQETGGTFVLPFSHKIEDIPSQEYINKHQLQVNATAGSVLIFNSMVFHRAGYNSSKNIRRAVNNVFTTPILKQQIDLPKFLDGKYFEDEFMRKFLGYDSLVADSVQQYRSKRLNR